MRTTHDIFGNADADFTTEWLDAAQLRELEPRISHDAISALDARGNATLSSQRFTQALAAAAETMGAEVLLAEATGIQTDGANHHRRTNHRRRSALRRRRLRHRPLGGADRRLAWRTRTHRAVQGRNPANDAAQRPPARRPSKARASRSTAESKAAKSG